MFKENIYQNLTNLTLDLVKIPSMVRTPHESQFGFELYERLSQITYFRNNRDNLTMSPLPGDPLNRYSIFAFLENKSLKNPNTVVLLSHYDTVGIEDYGELTP